MIARPPITGAEIMMNRGPTIADEIRDSCRRMLRLLEDPHPGLSTWQESVRHESEALKRLLPWGSERDAALEALEIIAGTERGAEEMRRIARAALKVKA